MLYHLKSIKRFFKGGVHNINMEKINQMFSHKIVPYHEQPPQSILPALNSY